eukprot:UN07809
MKLYIKYQISHIFIKILIKSMIKNQKFYPVRIVIWSFVGKKMYHARIY